LKFAKVEKKVEEGMLYSQIDKKSLEIKDSATPKNELEAVNN
jgi:hypothetical protein